MRIGAYVLAIVLLGAPAIRASFAEEQRSGTHDIAGSNRPAESSGGRAHSRDGDHHPAAENGVGPKSDGNSDAKQGQAIRGETASQGDARAGSKSGGINTPNGVEDHSVAKDFRSGAAIGRGVDPIDTRITVLPRRPDRKSDTVRDAKTKFKFGVRASAHVRAPLQSGASASAPRNAIGLPIAQHGDVQRRNGEPPGLSEQIAKPSELKNSQGRVGLSQIEPGPNHFNPARSTTGPGMPPATAKGGKINGTGFIRSGTTPFGIGGPAKTVAGINGTTITSKH
jgi:hypothetical protein